MTHSNRLNDNKLTWQNIRTYKYAPDGCNILYTHYCSIDWLTTKHVCNRIKHVCKRIFKHINMYLMASTSGTLLGTKRSSVCDMFMHVSMYVHPFVYMSENETVRCLRYVYARMNVYSSICIYVEEWNSQTSCIVFGYPCTNAHLYISMHVWGQNSPMHDIMSICIYSQSIHVCITYRVWI